MAAHDNGDPRTSITVVVGFVGAILLVVIVVALQGLYYQAERAERDAKVVAPVPEEVVLVRSEHEGELNSYDWVDREAGVVSIPIERAMDLVVRELGGDQTASGVGGDR